MFSPAPHSLFIHSHIDELHREATAHRLRAAARFHRRPDRNDATASTAHIGRERRPTYRFLRHYAEMVFVMFAGMFVLMAPADVLLNVFGTSWSGLSPAMNVFAMALTMTVPMVAWMRYRGHSRRANIEMAASMLIPTFAVMGVLWVGAAKGTLMVPEHAGMLICMFVAMLLRRDEYSCATHADGRTHAAVAA